MAEGAQTARQVLERQLNELGGLFNAGVRAQTFREWRQATLTCIQRLWPGDPSRSERFRRIPFSAPMGRPGEREVREYFERGCGEAGTLLKEYIAEVSASGAPGAATLGPGEVPASATPAMTHAAPPPKPRLKDLLGFTDAPEPGAGAPGIAPPQPQTSPATMAPVSKAPTQQHVPAPAMPTAGAAPPGQMPGIQPFGASSGVPPLPQGPPVTPPAAPTHAQPPVAPVAQGAPPLVQPPVVSPAGSASAAIPTLPGLESQPFFGPPSPMTRDGGPAAPAKPAAAEPFAPVPPPLRLTVSGSESTATPGTLAPHPGARLVHEPNALSDVPGELMHPAPIPLQPKHGERDRAATGRDRSPIAVAVLSLAQEVESLGVPEGHRARARAMLLELSRRLEEPQLEWKTLRDAFDFVMEFPTLGRRVVPLLLPYLDRAS